MKVTLKGKRFIDVNIDGVPHRNTPICKERLWGEMPARQLYVCEMKTGIGEFYAVECGKWYRFGREGKAFDYHFDYYHVEDRDDAAWILRCFAKQWESINRRLEVEKSMMVTFRTGWKYESMERYHNFKPGNLRYIYGAVAKNIAKFNNIEISDVFGGNWKCSNPFFGIEFDAGQQNAKSVVVPDWIYPKNENEFVKYERADTFIGKDGNSYTRWHRV